MARSAAENEASVLSFRRERLAQGVQVAHVTLRRGESSLLHSHTKTRDTFYIASGCLTLTLYEHVTSPEPSFRAIGARPAETSGVNGKRVLRFKLRPGDVLVIEPSVVHCAANLDDEPCSFLCVEGVGEYDFVLAEGS
jgi:mannose-6-phosphate isomerase-like protein (cupin superfamily)